MYDNIINLNANCNLSQVNFNVTVFTVNVTKTFFDHIFQRNLYLNNSNIYLLKASKLNLSTYDCMRKQDIDRRLSISTNQSNFLFKSTCLFWTSFGPPNTWDIPFPNICMTFASNNIHPSLKSAKINSCMPSKKISILFIVCGGQL